jgi:plasmid stabilization system protein ParE
MLAEFPDAARPLRRLDMFVFTVPGTKYLLIVRKASDTMTIATVLHGAEDWQRLYPPQ